MTAARPTSVKVMWYLTQVRSLGSVTQTYFHLLLEAAWTPVSLTLRSCRAGWYAWSVSDVCHAGGGGC